LISKAKAPTIIKIRNIKATGIHNGAQTHIYGQVIVPVSFKIKNTINTLTELQNRQLQDPFLKITADELLAGVRGVSVQRNQRDLRLFSVSISVVTKSFNLKTINFNISA